jgi:hypothetical protein
LILQFLPYCICIDWIFFRVESFDKAILLIKSIPQNNIVILFTEELYKPGLDRYQLTILTLAIISLLALEMINKRINLTQFLVKQLIVFRWSIYLSIIIILFCVYGDKNTSQFIYFQF